MQIRAALKDFSKYPVDEIAQIGMKGARGLKKGIKADRDKVAISKWRSQREDREQAVRNKAIKQDMSALIEEFL